MDQCENTAGNGGVPGASVLLSGCTIKRSRQEKKKKFSGKVKFCFENMGLKGIMWDLGGNVQKLLEMWF